MISNANLAKNCARIKTRLRTKTRATTTIKNGNKSAGGGQALYRPRDEIGRERRPTLTLISSGDGARYHVPRLAPLYLFIGV